MALMGMEALGDFATVSYFSVPTLTTAVYDTWLGYGSLNAAAKISAMMLLVVMLLISTEKYSRRKQQLYQKNTGQEQRELVGLSGWSKWLAIGWCWMLVILGFLLPSLVLVEYMIAYFDDSWSSELFEYGLNSLMVSGSAAAAGLFYCAVAWCLPAFKEYEFFSNPCSPCLNWLCSARQCSGHRCTDPPDTL